MLKIKQILRKSEGRLAQSKGETERIMPYIPLFPLLFSVRLTNARAESRRNAENNALYSSVPSVISVRFNARAE